jgi:hypothetical protein
MAEDSLETVARALLSIGAQELARTMQERAKQSTLVIYFQLGERLVEAGRNVSDGLWVNVSQPRPSSPAHANWRSIFNLTVPEFDSFDDSKKMEWLLSVPRDEAYLNFLLSHIDQLRYLST